MIGGALGALDSFPFFPEIGTPHEMIGRGEGRGRGRERGEGGEPTSQCFSLQLLFLKGSTQRCYGQHLNNFTMHSPKHSVVHTTYMHMHKAYAVINTLQSKNWLAVMYPINV